MAHKYNWTYSRQDFTELPPTQLDSLSQGDYFVLEGRSSVVFRFIKEGYFAFHSEVVSECSQQYNFYSFPSFLYVIPLRLKQ